MIGPASMGAIYHHTGPRWAWNLEFIVIAANILLLAIFHKRLIPLQIPNESASIINATSEEESSGDEEEDLMSIDIEIRGAGEESDKLHETQGSQVAV
uniref:MFS domain-containing protein n=1 Tax=Rhabditophanes sp. KR3021 TaxID=114890 RepID=A0AC35TTT7_9BILA